MSRAGHGKRPTATGFTFDHRACRFADGLPLVRSRSNGQRRAPVPGNRGGLRLYLALRRTQRPRSSEGARWS